MYRERLTFTFSTTGGSMTMNGRELEAWNCTHRQA
jgi:hypothetical protein